MGEVQKEYWKCRSKSAKTGNTVLSSKCVICGSKRPWSIKDQQTKGLLSSLGIKRLSIKIPLLGKILF